MKMSINPNIEGFLKYEEDLLAAVEKQIVVESNPRARVLLDCLQITLKSRAIKTFIDSLSARKFSLSSFHKIQEIDDALDELRILNLNLPYPEERFLIEKGKRERAQKYVLLSLLFGLFGIQWVE